MSDPTFDDILERLMDEVEQGLVSRVAGGAIVSGVVWGALGVVVAIGTGWLAPRIPSHPYTWIAGLATAMCALGPCAVIGWWSGFAGGVAKGIARVAEVAAPPILHRVFDEASARFDGSAVGHRVAAFEASLRAVTERIRVRARRVADRKGQGVMAKFRAGLFTRLADAIDRAYAQLDLAEETATMGALRPRFVNGATGFVVDVIDGQRRRLRSLTIAVWIAVFLVATAALLLIK